MDEVRDNGDLHIPGMCKWVRIRHRGKLTRVIRQKAVGNRVKIWLEKPVFAVAPGQSVVFYRKDGLVLGGGVI